MEQTDCMNSSWGAECVGCTENGGNKEVGCYAPPQATKTPRPEGSNEAPGYALMIAFVQGAKWWEYEKTGATMWQSDQHLAEAAAIRRDNNGTLGKLVFDDSA